MSRVLETSGGLAGERGLAFTGWMRIKESLLEKGLSSDACDKDGGLVSTFQLTENDLAEPGELWRIAQRVDRVCRRGRTL